MYYIFKGEYMMEALWTIEQAADYLGVKVHTLYVWTHHGSKNNFPFEKAGHLLRFRQSKIDVWLQRKTKTDAPEKPQEPPKPSVSPVKPRKGRDKSIDALVARAKTQAVLS
jgi:excisionase family DNA binding protein